MRIFTLYFQICLFLFLIVSTAPLFGNSLTFNLEKDIEFHPELIIPDTTCGLTDTVVQLTFPTCIGDADATARIEIMGSVGPFSFVWDNEARGATGTGLSAGKHFVTVTDLEGCMLIDSIIIADKPPFSYDIQTTDALCIGVSNGNITISDTAGYKYNWNTWDTLSNISNLAGGVYTVTITDTLGCTTSEMLTINNSTQAVLTIDGSNATCVGVNDGAATVNDTLNISGYSYLWNTGDTTNMLNGLQSGTYFVLVTSPEGCLAADSIDIGIEREVPLIASITNATCNGLSDGAISINDTLDVTGFQFGWSNGATTQSIDNLTAGVYSVAIADPTGCIAAATIEVPNTTPFSFTSIVKNGTCDVAKNGSIIINDSSDVTGYSFNWSTGDTTQQLSNVIPEIYGVTVTDENGCSASDSITIGITRDLLIGFTQTNTTCEGLNDGTITINGRDDFSDLIIVWSTGDSTQTLTGLAPTNYSFLVTDSVGCSVFGAPTITVGTTFDIDVAVTDASCVGVSDGSITLNDSLGIEGLTITWSTGDSTQTISELAAGEYTYVATDTAGCSQNGTVLVGNQLRLEVALIKTDVSCEGLSDGTIMASIPGGNSETSYSWSTGDSTQNLSNLAAGTYMVTATNSAGCIGTQSISILDLNSLSLTISPSDVSCSGLTDGSAIINQGTGIEGLTVNWSTGDTTQIISGLGTGAYSATVTDTNGCLAMEEFEITADSSLQIGLTGSSINCAGIDDGRINASVIGRASNDGLTFLWNTSDTTASISNLTPGSYEVTITEPTGCFGVGGVSLNPADTIDITLTTVNPACMDTSGTGGIIADVSGGSGIYSYNWNTGDTTSTIGQLVAGTYILTVSDSEGCIHIDSTTLVNPPILNVTATATQAATCIGTQDGIADVQVSGGTTPYNINWNTGLTTPTLSNLDPGIYTVEVTDAAGCQTTDSVLILQNTTIDLVVTELSSASGESIADAVATVSATGGQAPYSVNWDNGAMGDTVSNLSPGLHDLIVTDANGCTANGSIETGFFELDINIIEVRDLRCNGDVNGRATAAPQTGTMPFSYLWSTGDTTPVVTTLTGDEHTVTVTDAEGKRGIATVSIGEPQPINFNLEIIPPGCPTSSNGMIIINATGIVGNALYEFGFGVSPDPVINGVSAGDKRFGILDGRGCRADTMFTIEALSPNPPSPIFGVETLGLVATFTDSSTNQPNDYLWKFGDGSTSMETSPIHNYPDTGNYEVCLIVGNSCATDSICQMIRISPIPVPAVDLFFGRDTSGLSGQVVSIPVTVGAFDEVAGISGTFELTNPTIGTIQGVRALNLPALVQENIGFQDNLVNIDWQLPDSLDLVSLPVGTQIFVIDVLLTGASNECSRIMATNTESPVQFIKTFNGQLVPAPFTITSAEICVAQTVSIAGNISREESMAIEGVMVTTNGDVAFTTAADGNYALPGLPGGATFNITPAKSDDLLEGVTAFDLVRILQHILTQAPLESPYKIIAADIDNSGSVSSLDLVHLQRLILGNIDAFPNNQPWRFVPENYTFVNPANPLAEDFPESIELTRLEIDTANIDFIAIKVGDVIGGGNAGTARFSSKPMGFQIEEQSFKAGDLVVIPFNIDQSTNSLGFQVEIAFDQNKLAFKEASKGNFLNISEHNLGINNIEAGRLKLLWVNQQQVAIRPFAKGAFQLEFLALQDGNLSEVLHLENDKFPAQFYNKEGKQIGVQPIDLVINNALITAEEVEEILLPTEMAFMQGGENTIDGGCGDGVDNDNDGLIDCADADCFCECNTADGANLIINPGAEASLSSGGWQLVQGTWTTKSIDPEPQNGAAYFYPLNSETGQISQVVDLSADADAIDQGMVSYVFSGYAISLDQDPADQGRILIEYRNENDSTVASFDTGLLSNTQDWMFIGDTILAPVGTRTAIINLMAFRNNGSNNDAYFDNLFLGKLIEEDCVEPCADVELFTFTTEAIPNGIGGTANATLIGGSGPITYSWSNGENTNEVSNLTAGNYTIIATDSIGCTAMDSIEIKADSTFFANLNIVNNTCFGENNGTISVEIIGGNAPFTLVWSDSTLSGDSLQNLPDGDYTLTITDSTNATVVVSATINSGGPISLSSADSKIVAESCPNVGDGQLSLVAEGGMAPYTYIIGTDTTDNGVYLNLNAGTYIVNIIDVNGCSANDTILIGNTIAGTLSAEFTAAVDDLTINLNSAVNDTSATYSWTFGNGSTSTEMNPSVTYTEVGAFEICLSITNDCGTATTCQTLSVGVTGPITFVVNNLNGAASDTVVIPVTVNNFVNIVSYQKTIQIQDTSLARFVGIASMNLDGLTAENFFQIDDHTITNVWFDNTATGQTLTNNTVIYNLMVLIDSEVDTCVGISIVNNPVASQVVGIMGNEVAEVPFEIDNGEICTQATAQITGNILRETGTALAGVQIGVSNFDMTPTTNINGDYLVEKLSIGNPYEITPALNTPLLESVSTFDIVLINRHILGTRTLDSPYKIIAADINQSGSITVFDLVLIQRAILQLNSEFPGNSAWRFIPTSYQFLDPLNPLDEAFPESISIENLSGNLANQDFVAIKVADVSYNVPTAGLVATPRTSETLNLAIANQNYVAGEILEIPVTTKELHTLSGFQFELDFDRNNLEFLGVETVDVAGLGQNNVGVHYLNQGKIQMVWVAPTTEIGRETTTLFNLRFRAKATGNLSNKLQLANRFLASESYTKDLGIGEIALNITDNSLIALDAMKVFPNPSKGLVDLTFANDNKEAVQIAMYNFAGQLVREWKNITADNMQINLTNQADGTYLIMLKRAAGVEVKRVVLSR